MLEEFYEEEEGRQKRGGSGEEWEKENVCMSLVLSISNTTDCDNNMKLFLFWKSVLAGDELPSRLCLALLTESLHDGKRDLLPLKYKGTSSRWLGAPRYDI